MHFDLIPERDRFIPGWHTRPDISRAEFARPEWHWPFRLYRTGQTLLKSLLQAYCVAIRLAEDFHPIGHQMSNDQRQGSKAGATES
jgi:hypothetical protein